MKRTIYILAFGAFGIVTTEFGIIGILPDLVKQFHISIEKAGWLLSVFALTIALTGPFANMLTARLNRKFALCLVLCVFVISNLLSAVAPNFTALMIARVLPAFLHSVFWAVSLSVAAKQTGPKDAPKAISTVVAGLSVATVLGVPLTTYMADLFSWRASFVLCAGINLLAFTALAIFVPSMPVNKHQASSKSQVTVLRSVNLWIKFLASTIFLAGIFATYGYLAEYLDKVSHMNGTQISIMLLIFGSTGIIGNWLTGIALSKNVLLTIRFVLISLVIVHILAYQFGSYFIPIAIIISIWGLLHTAGFLVSNLQITSGMQGPALDFVNSLLPSFGNAGVTIGMMLGGFFIAHYGIHQVIWISVALILLAFAMSFIYKYNEIKTAQKSEAEKYQPKPTSAILCE